MKSRAPLIIAIMLLLLPMLYVGSYLALVLPPGAVTVTVGRYPVAHVIADYRIAAEQARWLFWPLEQIDRKVRPWSWAIEQ